MKELGFTNQEIKTCLQGQSDRNNVESNTRDTIKGRELI